MDEVREAVDNAKNLLSDCGVDLDVTADQLWDWFDTELQVPDIDLCDLVIDPLLVVHELVEIDEILKMGLKISKEVLTGNPEKVEEAHLKAVRVELMVAKSIGAAQHLDDMVRSVERWCKEKTLSERRRAEYMELLAQAKEELRHITRLGP